MKIDKTAIVHPQAKLSDDIEIGPYATIGKNVIIEKGARIGARVSIEGWTQIGKNCRIFTGAVVGSISQDLKYRGKKAKLIIGDNNVIREYVTLNLGSSPDRPTVIGNDNLIMAYAHVAHDCKVGNKVIMANAATLAGHVVIEDKVIIGGLTAIHQFCRMGMLSITGGCSKVTQDIIPYSVADGHPARPYGLNIVGLKRANFSSSLRLQLNRAFKWLFGSNSSISKALKKIENEIPSSPELSNMINFIKTAERGISR